MKFSNKNDVNGVNAKTHQNEDTGKIKEITLDTLTGKIAYVVLSFGGFLGLSDKLFALPWNILIYDPFNDCFRIPVDNDVICVDVKNHQDEDIGKIEAVVLDKLTGKVAYVVLSYAGFLGLGDQLFALPWSKFSYDASDDYFKIPVDNQKIRNSPGFDKDHWPDMSDPHWNNSILNYYDATI